MRDGNFFGELVFLTPNDGCAIESDPRLAH
jgi:hypothetical protein